MRVRTRRQRGIALMTVILILLVLTVLGMTATMMMTQEDRLSSRQEIQKEAFYAAEAGLRHGERVFEDVTLSAAALTEKLQATYTPAPSCPATIPHAPVHPPASRNPAAWTVQTLGTYLGVGGVAIANRELESGSLTGRARTRRAYYSLYVRNNPEDAGNLDTPVSNQDPDNRLRLVSVGFITDGSGVDGSGQANVLAVRIVEEEIAWESRAGGTGMQDLQNAGGTGSLQWGGARADGQHSGGP